MHECVCLCACLSVFVYYLPWRGGRPVLPPPWSEEYVHICSICAVCMYNIQILIFINTYMYVLTYMYCAYMYVCVSHIYIIFIFMYTYTYVCIWTYIYCVYIYMYTNIYDWVMPHIWMSHVKLQKVGCDSFIGATWRLHKFHVNDSAVFVTWHPLLFCEWGIRLKMSRVMGWLWLVGSIKL